jgi:hypothetical protein
VRSSAGLANCMECASAWHALLVPSLDADGWELLSGVERHAKNPETFEIPDEAVRSRLVPGCDAKLIFALRGHDEERVERMWVHIVGYTETGYAGVLNNEPRTPGTPLALGERIEFGPDHIIDALPPANWDPETGRYRE